MDRLLKHGFVRAGYWHLQDDGIRYVLLSCHKAKEVLYAFIHQTEVKYIGKTVREVEKRMYGYQNPNKSQSTNNRIHNNIKKLLDAGEYIDILIFVNANPQKHGDYNINLAAGLEDELIAKIKPEWNGRIKSATIEVSNKMRVKTNDQDKNIALASMDVIRFDIFLGEAYYNRGYFNVPTKYANRFGADGEKIEIRAENKFCHIIMGKIDRKDNKNGTPRIKGSILLRDWIQENFRSEEVMKVEVLANAGIRLYK